MLFHFDLQHTQTQTLLGNIEAHSISDPYTKHYRRHLNIGQYDPIMSVSVCVVSQNGTAFSTLSTVT
jgi:hypothetical protein